MEQKSRSVFAVLAAVVIVVAVFSSFAISLFGQNSYQIGLPDLTGEGGDRPEGSGGGAGSGFVWVELTPETVQNVIATLFRPRSYYRELSIELWADDETPAQTIARVWVDEDWTRSDVTAPDGTVQHNLVGEGTHWLWYNGSDSYRTYPADEASSDLVQRIPTYEDVLKLPQDQITAAAYESFTGESCIFVEVEQEELDSVERYWIAVSNGLLLAAERVRDGRVVYRMTALSTESPAPLTSSFALPNGEVRHTVGEGEE